MIDKDYFVAGCLYRLTNCSDDPRTFWWFRNKCVPYGSVLLFLGINKKDPREYTFLIENELVQAWYEEITKQRFVKLT